MKRFLISGSQNFNNYYLFSQYVTQYLPDPRYPILHSCGGPVGTDAMVREYSTYNKFPLEEYQLAVNTVNAMVQRNTRLIGMCHTAILFHDGTGVTVIDLIKRLSVAKKPTVVVELTPFDNYDFNWELKDDTLLTLMGGDNQPINSHTIADTTLALLGTPDIIRRLLELNQDAFVPSPEHPHLAAGILKWLRVNAEPRLLEIANPPRPPAPVHRPSADELVAAWNKSHPCPVWSSPNFPIFQDFEVLLNNNKVYLEADDALVCKDHLWQPEELDEMESDLLTWYTPKDNSKVRVFTPNYQSDYAPYRLNHWYVDASTVLPGIV